MITCLFCLLRCSSQVIKTLLFTLVSNLNMVCLIALFCFFLALPYLWHHQRLQQSAFLLLGYSIQLTATIQKRRGLIWLTILDHGQLASRDKHRSRRSQQSKDIRFMVAEQQIRETVWGEAHTGVYVTHSSEAPKPIRLSQLSLTTTRSSQRLIHIFEIPRLLLLKSDTKDEIYTLVVLTDIRSVGDSSYSAVRTRKEASTPTCVYSISLNIFLCHHPSVYKAQQDFLVMLQTQTQTQTNYFILVFLLLCNPHFPPGSHYLVHIQLFISCLQIQQ